MTNFSGCTRYASFNPKLACAKKKIADGTLGKPVSIMVSHHLSRSLGKRIAGRVRLPAPGTSCP
jgi:predicted dehydrogenase